MASLLRPECIFPRHPHGLLHTVFKSLSNQMSPFKGGSPFLKLQTQHFQSLTLLCIFLGIADLLRLYNLVYFLSAPLECNPHKGRDLGPLFADVFPPLEGWLAHVG